MNAWVPKMGYTHITEPYSTSTRKGILIRATTWINLKTLCQVKEASHKKDKSVGFHLHESIASSDSQRQNLSLAAGAGERGRGELLLVGKEFQLRRMKTAL